MPGSTTSLFPDINVWVALTYEGHAHHTTAAAWLGTLKPGASLIFCRFTQPGLLRLLTTEAVMGDEVIATAGVGGLRSVAPGSGTLSGSHAPPSASHKGLG